MQGRWHTDKISKVFTQDLIGHNLTHMAPQNFSGPGFYTEFRPCSFMFSINQPNFWAPGPGARPQGPGPGPRARIWGQISGFGPKFGAQGGPGPKIWTQGGQGAQIY